VIFGRNGSTTSDWTGLDLNTLSGATTGFMITGAAGHYLGYTAGTIGDVNGDGIDDVAATAQSASPGYVTVVFGRPKGTAFPDVFSQAMVDGSAAINLQGQSMYIQSAAGADVNGDAIADIITGSPSATIPGRGNFGRAYVVFGRASGVSWPSGGIVDLTALDGTDGFIINNEGSVDTYFAWSVSTAGDFNGDSVDDFLIGAYTAGPITGRVYVMFGNRAPSITRNAMTIQSAGESVAVTSAVLMVSDNSMTTTINFPADITINVVNATHGQFQRVSGGGVEISNFTMEEVVSGTEIVFKHDGSARQPTIALQAVDPGHLASTVSFTFITGFPGTQQLEMDFNISRNETLNTTELITELAKVLNISADQITVTIIATEDNKVTVLVVLPEVTPVSIDTLLDLQTTDTTNSRYLRRAIDVRKIRTDPQASSTITTTIPLAALLAILPLFP